MFCIFVFGIVFFFVLFGCVVSVGSGMGVDKIVDVM